MIEVNHGVAPETRRYTMKTITIILFLLFSVPVFAIDFFEPFSIGDWILIGSQEVLIVMDCVLLCLCLGCIKHFLLLGYGNFGMLA